MSSNKPLTLIVAATAKNLGIGHNGTLPWRLKSELSYFARVTTRIHPPATSSRATKNVVLMGRKTWLSIPPKFRPLRDRINIVISRNPTLDLEDGVILAGSVDEALLKLETLDQEGEVEVGRVFVIGGAEIYRSAVLHRAVENILLTRVDGVFECDTFFPVDVKEEGSGWCRKDYDELCSFTGEQAPKGIQKDGNVEYEFELWRKQ